MERESKESELSKCLDDDDDDLYLVPQHIVRYFSSSSWSSPSHDDNKDSLDSLSPSVPIGHYFCHVF